MSRDYPDASSVKALGANGDGAVLVTSERSIQQRVDPSPVVRRFSANKSGEVTADKVSTPAWWRADDSMGVGTPEIAIAGDTLWLVYYDIIFVRAHGGWRTIEANPQPPTHFMRLYSAPLEGGDVYRHGAPNGSSSSCVLSDLGDRSHVPALWRRWVPRRRAADGLPGYEELVGRRCHRGRHGRTFGAALSIGGDALRRRRRASPARGLGLRRDPRIFGVRVKPFRPRSDSARRPPGTHGHPRSATVSLSLDTIGIGSSLTASASCSRGRVRTDR